MRYIIVIDDGKQLEIYGTNTITKQDLKDCNPYSIKIIDSKENLIYNEDTWEELIKWED